MGRASAAPPLPTDDGEEVGLLEAATFLLEECRMVLPGIQALFGFQLIAVFSERFTRDLSVFEKDLHFGALALSAVAIAFVMAPAAYHRQLGVHYVTEAFVLVSTRLLIASMVPLAAAIALDFYLIARLVIGNAAAPILAAALVAVFVMLWAVLPRWRRLQRLIAS